jgi:hypothetical protein
MLRELVQRVHHVDGRAREGNQTRGWYSLKLHSPEIERPHGST